jgi:hypothetical protein
MPSRHHRTRAGKTTQDAGSGSRFQTTQRTGVRGHSEEREAFERRHRFNAMERVRARLEKLAHRVTTGRLKVPEKIGAAAARILARNHGHRYYDWC